MSALPTYFKDFLSNIRPTRDQRAKMKKEHKTLRERLSADETLGPLIVSTFIQGSYRRMTATQPYSSEPCDVDVIAVTTMHEDDYTPQQALEQFRPFLREYYRGKFTLQGRSWGILVDDEVCLDLVPTSAPSEAERKALEWAKASSWDFPDEPDFVTKSSYDDVLFESSGSFVEKFMRAAADSAWRDEPLRIPDREANKWEDTHPLEQIRWTWEKSRATNGHYVNVVKALKWWRKVKFPKPKHPKSYPFEHLIGDSLQDGIDSVASGVTLTLESMEATYRRFVDAGTVPVLRDRGVPNHNVLARVSSGDFGAFLDGVKDASEVARNALDATTVKESADLWRQLFGDQFPEAPEDDDDGGDSGGGGKKAAATGGFSPRAGKTVIGGERFA